MSKHTPGPWKVDPLNYWKIIQEGSGLDICSLLGNRANIEANVRLIAAAPETAAERDRYKTAFESSDEQCGKLLDGNLCLLLERDGLKAINAILLEALKQIMIPPPPRMQESYFEYLCEIARAAIAKATEK